jgi:hypothetical protein
MGRSRRFLQRGRLNAIRQSTDQAFTGWTNVGGEALGGPPSCSPFAQPNPEAATTEVIGCFALRHDTTGQTLIFNKFTGSITPAYTFRGSWSGWSPVPNAPSPIGNPSATAYPSSRTFVGEQIYVASDVDVFFSGGSGAGVLQHGSLSGGTFHFEQVGGLFGSGSCSRTQLIRIDCVATGYTNTSLYHIAWLQPAPQIMNFYATNPSVNSGGSTMLNWSVSLPGCDQRYCHIMVGKNDPAQPPGTFNIITNAVNLPSAGSIPVTLTQDTTYQLVANAGYNLSHSEITVKVYSAPPPQTGTIVAYASFSTGSSPTQFDAFTTALNGTLTTASGACGSCTKSFTQAGTGDIDVSGNVSVGNTTVTNLYPGTWQLRLSGSPGPYTGYKIQTFTCNVAIQASHITLVLFGTQGLDCASTVE